MAGSFPIFRDPNSGFQIGIGDSNGDGKFDFDFGLRSGSYGNGPFGGGGAGVELGINTARGGYIGADQSSWGPYGVQGSSGRIFADGGHQAGSYSRDVFGNYNQGYSVSSPQGYHASNGGGNIYSGNYYGNQVGANGWGSYSDSVVGNTWTGAQMGSHSRGNAYGGGSWNSYNPGYVPSFGAQIFHGGGCGCAGRFLGY